MGLPWFGCSTVHPFRRPHRPPSPSSSLRSSKTARVQPPHPLRATQVCVPPLPRRPAVRRDDPQLPYSCPDQRHPTPSWTNPPRRTTGVVRRVRSSVPPLRERREWSAGCLEKERSTFRQGRSPVCSLATRNTRG